MLGFKVAKEIYFNYLKNEKYLAYKNGDLDGDDEFEMIDYINEEKVKTFA